MMKGKVRANHNILRNRIVKFVSEIPKGQNVVNSRIADSSGRPGTT